MPTVEFAAALTRHVPCPRQEVGEGSLGEVLDAAFRAAPALRTYVVDEQGAVRRHVAVFVNGELIPDRGDLTRPLARADRVHVIQALTGG